MRIKTRSGTIEEVQFSKIQQRLQEIQNLLNIGKHISIDEIARDTINEVHDMISTQELDEHAARIAAGKGIDHPDYLRFAGGICVSNLFKETKGHTFSGTVVIISKLEDSNGIPLNLLDPKYVAFVEEHAKELDDLVDDRRDYMFDFIGIKTLIRSYLIRDRVSGNVLERPQHMFMRVAIALHLGDLQQIAGTYELLSNGYYTHATPTLYNAGTCRQQLASCFLGGFEDSITEIYKWITDCAKISKWAGGLGMHVHNIRATGSLIRGLNGTSNGLIPMLQVFNATARYVDQGGGKRKGSIAVYLEPWHADIIDFLEMKTNTGDENRKARDLFLALWIPDLFMQRVVEDKQWSLMCPNDCPGLPDCYGEEFVRLYESYEQQGKVRRTMNAREIFRKIMEVQIETGVPYMCYKDAVNRKTNQQNIGVIKSSNLCSEIMEYSDSKEYACCNLASLNLNRFVTGNTFDFQKLRDVAYLATINLDRVIDLNFYPCDEAKYSNTRHRPVGLGVQGLADVFYKLKVPYECNDAKQINKKIFETIYFGALEASVDLAKLHGPYETFKGSPMSKGLLQFDLWDSSDMPLLSPQWNWDELKQNIKIHGVRNSLLTAVMPTASTAQIMGNYECVEPPNSNIYTRRTIAGTFTIINKYLVDDLMKLGIWSTQLRDSIIRNDGSIQGIDMIPDDIKTIYKTTWEISQRTLIDLSADRGVYVDQSQSLNLFMAVPDFNKLFNMHIYGWRKGLKAGMYYLRTRPATTPIKFSLGTANSCSSNENCESCSA